MLSLSNDTFEYRGAIIQITAGHFGSYYVGVWSGDNCLYFAQFWGKSISLLLYASIQLINRKINLNKS